MKKEMSRLRDCWICIKETALSTREEYTQVAIDLI
jgi:hypothetical protein